jgi:hypothetical protein
MDPHLRGLPALQFARLTGLPVPPGAVENVNGFQVAVADPITLHAACTAARLASLLPTPAAGEVAAEFLAQLGLPREQFDSWEHVARVLGALAGALN